MGVAPEIDLSKLTVTEKDALIPSLLPLSERWHEWAVGGAAGAGVEAAEDA